MPLKIANIKGSSCVLPAFQSTLAAQTKRERLEKTENKAVRNIRGEPPQAVMKHGVSSPGNMCNYKGCMLCKQQKLVQITHFTYTYCTVYVPVRVHQMPEEARDMGKGTARTIVLHSPRMSISGARGTWTPAALADRTQVIRNLLYLQPPLSRRCNYTITSRRMSIYWSGLDLNVLIGY